MSSDALAPKSKHNALVALVAVAAGVGLYVWYKKKHPSQPTADPSQYAQPQSAQFDPSDFRAPLPPPPASACTATGPPVLPEQYSPYSGSQMGSAYNTAESMQGGANQLNLLPLMPESWQNPSSAASTGNAALDQWSQYAPTADGFARYIQAGGSSRLSAISRSSLGRQVGMPNLMRPGVAAPISTGQYVFNDSSQRADLVYDATGSYPKSTNC